MDSFQPGPASAGLLVLVGGTVGSEVYPDHTLAADGRGRGASGRHGSNGGDAGSLQSPQTRRCMRRKTRTSCGDSLGGGD